MMARTPCPGSSIASSNGARGVASRASATASGCRLDSASRAAICSSRAVDRGGIDDARLRQRQRAGLVEDHRVDFGQPLDGVAGIQDHAGAEQRAGRHHLHRRDRQRQRAGTGDDQHRDRRDHARHARDAPAISQPISVSAAVEMHHRRIDARGAVGEPHSASDLALAALSSSRSISSSSVSAAGRGDAQGQRAVE